MADCIRKSRNILRGSRRNEKINEQIPNICVVCYREDNNKCQEKKRTRKDRRRKEKNCTKAQKYCIECARFGLQYGK